MMTDEDHGLVQREQLKGKLSATHDNNDERPNRPLSSLKYRFSLSSCVPRELNAL